MTLPHLTKLVNPKSALSNKNLNFPAPDSL
jgi:hypothetical protein